MSLAAVPKQTAPFSLEDAAASGPANGLPHPGAPHLGADPESQDLLHSFQRITTPALRRTALGVVQTLASHEPRVAAPAPRRAPASVQARPLVVLKFGSSVLRSPADAPEAVTEIYRAVRAGRRVVAVVSAFEGVTDRLIADARALGCGHDNIHLPRYVAMGEETSAALLALACDRAGLSVTALPPGQIGITAEGDRENATPVSFDRLPIETAFERHDVVIVPGFTARDAKGEVVLLGRGGSDLTAVYLGAELAAERVRLVKDVDGVYDRDPKSHAEAIRFGAISWADARGVAGKLIQDRALDLAQGRGLIVEVGAIGRETATRIGPEGGPPARRSNQARLRVAIAGCGVVGGGLIQRLWRRSDAFEIVSVLVRDTQKPRDVAVGAVLTDDPKVFLASRPDVIVDALSCARTGAELAEAALSAGVHVVSANKQGVILAHARLVSASERGRARLLYSASVGGGAPLVETVRAARAQGPVARVEGVLNGTVNFLLARLAAGDTFESALAQAQAAGLAEEDPSSDLDGRDAAAKLRILALEAFNVTLSEADVVRAPLDEAVIRAAAIAPLKQVSCLSLENGQLKASVSFAPDPAFASADADRNLLRVTGAEGRVWTARGRGAGRWPTTESVLSDLLDLRAPKRDVKA